MATKSSCPSFCLRLLTNCCRRGSPSTARFTMSRRARCCAMQPRTRAPLRAADDHLTDEQGRLLAHIFRRELSSIRRMTFVNIQSSARRLIAADAIQTCQTCAIDKPTSASRRQFCAAGARLGASLVVVVCRSHLRAIGQGGVTNSEDDPPALASWEEVLEGERLLDDFAEGGIQTWASPIDLLRLLLIRRDPKPIDPERWIETPKVLDLVIPGFDNLVAETGTIVPPADRPILPLSLRPTLLAGIAIAERSGPKIVAEIHGRTIGAYHAHFGTIAASILASYLESHLCS